VKTRYCEIMGIERLIDRFNFVLDGSIESIIERIEVTTGLSPDPLYFKIHLVDFSDDVQAQMQEWYPGQQFKQVPGYTDNERKTILFATVYNLQLKTIVHELTHMLLNLQFTEQEIPKELHEIIAQRMEELIK